MTSNQDLFQQAQLAEAAYANLVRANGLLLTSDEDVKAALRDASNSMSFSEAQATAFVAEWEVIDHVPDTSGGFSATIFRNRPAGRLHPRDSRLDRSLTDFAADAALIVLDGLAAQQMVDLYNYWQRADRGPERQLPDCDAGHADHRDGRVACSVSYWARLPDLLTKRCYANRTNVVIDNPSHTVRTIPLRLPLRWMVLVYRRRRLMSAATVSAGICRWPSRACFLPLPAPWPG